MAPRIVAELGKHTQYFEPFCGSMAVLFAKTPSQKETVNDLHGDLINLATVIQDATRAEQLYDRLQRAVMSEAILDQAREALSASETLDAIDRAYWYFVGSWMGRNGTAGTERIDYQIAVRWTKNGGSPVVRWRNALESLPAWHRRLQNVVILQRDAFRIIDRFEDVSGTAIYADPPYCRETRSRIDRSGRYLHEFNHDADMFDHDQHRRLAEVLSRYRNARVVVSYYDCPRVRELYEGWTFIDCTRQKHLHAIAGRGARPKTAPEVLIVNGPSFTQN